MDSKFALLLAHGQSLWYDNISRDLLDSGGLQMLVSDGIRGLTSNPTIFQKAVSSGTAYDMQIRELARRHGAPEDIYEALAVDDIRRAADILCPVYDSSGGEDGFVSLEVSPLLARDTQGTIAEATRLFRRVDRPNLMIKIPATPEGLPAIEEAVFSGLNVNVTLIFSCDMYARVMNAYLRGLERRVEAGQDINRIASVASFFVSRVDTAVDKLLEERITTTGDTRLVSLKGQAAVANTKLAYQLFRQTFAGPRWQALAARGARVQRPLWASTSTKNPAYPDLIYVENLIGPHTVNTAPPHTIEAFRDHGVVADTLEQGIDAAQAVMDDLAAAGIDMTAVTAQLLEEGIKAFADSFDQLLKAIADRSQALTGRPQAHG